MGIGKKMFILLSFSSSPYQPQKMLHIVRTKKKKKSHLPNGIRNNFMKKKSIQGAVVLLARWY